VIEQLLQADRLLTVDLVDQAEAAYAAVADADPNNAIAVVGLARCALAREEDRKAYELAGRALSIDPENDMARRMEARLSEILAMRGESVARPPAATAHAEGEPWPVVGGTLADAAPDDQGPTGGTPRPPRKEAGPEPERRRGLLDRLRGR
jgi:tetratricopeptide (TPR) repeat protein